MAWDSYCIQEFLPNVAFAYVIDIFIAQFTFQIFFTRGCGMIFKLKNNL